MNSDFKQKIPPLFLIVVSVWWAFYYQSNNILNDFGEANFEWLYLIDGLLVLPLLCFLCIDNKKEAAIKVLVYSGTVIFVGSVIIPSTSKVLWLYLESGRYLLLPVFIILEVIAVLTIVIAVKAALSRGIDPDEAISSPITSLLGKGLISDIICFEARIWSYVLFSKAIKTNNFRGKKHFSYHEKDGAQSNSMGFIVLILFEAPLMHLVLHFLWSPVAANIITLLTLFGLVFLFAENRAMAIRPISIDESSLIIRYGVFNSKVILLKNIKSIKENNNVVPRSKSVKQYDFEAAPNVVISLIEPEGQLESIYLGVDKPKHFIASMTEAKSLLNS